jgi:hypothetical protein
MTSNRDLCLAGLNDTIDSGLDLLIPNTVLVPKGSLPFRLLSPQHFGQENFKSGIDSTDRGTINLTSGIENVLSWGDLAYRVTTQLTQGSNIALLNSDAGYTKFSSFVDVVAPADEPAYLFTAHLVPDDESIHPIHDPADDLSLAPLHLDAANEGDHEGDHEGDKPTSATITNNLPHVIDFLEGEGEFCLPTVEEAEDDGSKLDNPTHELLLFHYRLAHEPFKNLQQMA